MIDLTTIDQETLIARGQYSTVRAAHEDEKKHLALLCGQFASIPPQVLRHMQPADDTAPDVQSVNSMLAAARKTLDAIEACVATINGLAAQRAALKSAAWGR